MGRYFSCMSTIERFTRELDRHHDVLQCNRCHKRHCFVSHGFVYKKQNHGEKQVTGKRIFCSNRSGRSGCGATQRLYDACVIDSLQYNCSHLLVFLRALIGGSAIQKAYATATNTNDPRNAYRWLIRLRHKLGDYRRMLKRHPFDLVSVFATRSQRLRILLPSIVCLIRVLGSNPCSHFQLRCQKAFV